MKKSSRKEFHLFRLPEQATKQGTCLSADSNKVNQIVNFLLHDPMAIFPTNLVVAIPNHAIKEQIDCENSTEVEIVLDEKVFSGIKNLDRKQKGDIYLSVIDGQHRVRGIEKTIEYLEDKIRINEEMIRTSQDNKKFEYDLKEANSKLASLKSIELSVTFFIDPVLEYQAMIFSTINRTQTKVSPDLVYTLFGLTKNDSPQKSILNIVNALNGQEYSPFHKRIRLAGSGTKEARMFYETGNPVLSQATVIQSLLSFICKDKQELENARHFKRKYFKNAVVGLPFRSYYGNNKDSMIMEILDAYYTAISKTFIDEDGISFWEFELKNTRKPRNILQSTIGFLATLEILRKLLTVIPEDKKTDVDEYHKHLSKASTLDIRDEKEPKKYPFANKTKNVFYNDLGGKIWGSSFEKKPIKD